MWGFFNSPAVPIILLWKLRAKELSVMQDHIDERNSCFFFNNQ